LATGLPSILNTPVLFPDMSAPLKTFSKVVFPDPRKNLIFELQKWYYYLMDPSMQQFGLLGPPL
jgi:hypothetical protein